MINNLSTLKEKSEEVIDYNNYLKRITKEIINPKTKKFLTDIFLISFAITFILILFYYIISDNFANYSIIHFIIASILISLFVSIILIGIIYLPVTIILKNRRERIFNKYKPEIDYTLNSISEIFGSLNEYPEILRDYFDAYYLDMLMEIIENEKICLDDAISKFKEEKKNNKRIKNKSIIADKRIFKCNLLLELSIKSNITTSNKIWVENYLQ